MFTRLLNKLRRASKPASLPLAGYEASDQFPILDGLNDEELERLNSILPWSSWVVDQNGRRFGNRFSVNKRTTPEQIPDHRIVELNRRFDLSDKKVLEIGCFEGNHTIALSRFASEVVAIDARIENVAKTLVRCAMADRFPAVYCVDVESDDFDYGCDVLHHVGVLYHLKDPVTHLNQLLPAVSRALMLDTHVAPADVALEEEGGVKFWRFSEHGRDNPFAGMYDDARWLSLPDLERIVIDNGFEIESIEHRDERNGPRVLIYASRAM